MRITSFDHVAVPMDDETGMVAFYKRLGFGISKLDDLTYAIQFGENKIHFHTRALWERDSFDLRGPTAIPGCGDFCFVWNGELTSIIEFLSNNEIAVIAGPMKNVGAREGGIEVGQSVYIRDPDQNLLEFIVYG